jgi:hypothetical protein
VADAPGAAATFCRQLITITAVLIHPPAPRPLLIRMPAAPDCWTFQTSPADGIFIENTGDAAATVARADAISVRRRG